MKQLKNSLLVCAGIAFNVVIGGAVYEHIAVVPQWSAAPPVSLSMFQGKYGLNPAPFWQIIHPVTLTFLIGALVTNRKNPRKNLILFTLISYVTILVITAIYFVPQLIKITTMPYAGTVDATVLAQAAMWERLSLVRLTFLLIISGALLLALTKPANAVNQRNEP